MAWYPFYVRCAFCGKYGEKPKDEDVPLLWFFVARPREAKPDEQTQHQVHTTQGVETITTTVAVDRWLLCSDNCLAHIGELGTT